MISLELWDYLLYAVEYDTSPGTPVDADNQPLSKVSVQVIIINFIVSNREISIDGLRSASTQNG
jgi:hypothetical protein